MNKKNIGSTLDSLLEETGELDEVNERVSKRIFADQLRQAMTRKKLSTTDVARRMGTSRFAVSRLLDPSEPGVTLGSLVRASAAVGKRFVPRLVDSPNDRGSATFSKRAKVTGANDRSRVRARPPRLGRRVAS